MKITRPGRDAQSQSDRRSHGGGGRPRTISACRMSSLHYSVNGGAEKTVSMLKQQGRQDADGTTTIALEDFKWSRAMWSACTPRRRTRAFTAKHRHVLHRSAAVRAALHAIAADAAAAVAAAIRTTIRTRSPSAQKEIIAATWNQMQRPPGDKGTAAGERRRSSPRCRPSCATRRSRWPTA